MLEGNIESIMKTPKTLEVERIADAIYKAIITQRLKAGTRLVETKLVEIFNANRNHVRAAIEVLNLRKVVDVKPNKGAFVANPGPDDARDIFQARRVIESKLVVLATEQCTAKDLRKLESLIERETQANNTGNRSDMVRLSGDFHLELARIVGNQRLYEMLELQIAGSSLIAGLYERNRDFLPSIKQHGEILEAMKKKNFTLLPELMDKHLLSIEEKLLASYGDQVEPDLADIFS